MVSEHEIRELAEFNELKDRLFIAYSMTKGNIVEIGGGEGQNTIQFLLDKSRITIVVDPFEQIPGADESYFKPYPYEKFYKNVVGYADHLKVIRKPSQHLDVFEELKTWKPIGFMFIDGLQDKASVLSDLRLAESLNAEIICVDDYERLTTSSQVPLAVIDFRATTNYKFIDIGKREAYFIR